MNKAKILIIGAGTMGTAYSKALLKILPPENICLTDRLLEKTAPAKAMGIVHTANHASEFIKQVDFILLAVKPQDAYKVFEDLKGTIHKKQIVISIMAGMQIAIIQEQLSVQKVVRAMPNLPLLVDEGMTAFAVGGLDNEDLQQVNNILRPTGKVIQLENEQMIDAITAISGSGPAYAFYFVQQIVSTANKMGFNKEDAFLLALQTFKGALQLIETADLSCEEWITKVCSKGGTTERAISHFKDMGMDKIIEDAMFAALNRSKELSKK